jgi:hypothetical protein
LRGKRAAHQRPDTETDEGAPDRATAAAIVAAAPMPAGAPATMRMSAAMIVLRPGGQRRQNERNSQGDGAGNGLGKRHDPVSSGCRFRLPDGTPAQKAKLHGIGRG